MREEVQYRPKHLFSPRMAKTVAPGDETRDSPLNGSREKIEREKTKERRRDGARERKRERERTGNWQSRRLLLVRAIIRLEELSARDDWSTCPSDGNITITTTIVSRKAITAHELWPRDTVDVHVRSDAGRTYWRLLIIDRGSRSSADDKSKEEEKEKVSLSLSLSEEHGRRRIRKNVLLLHPTGCGRTYYPGTFVTKIRLYAYDRVDGPDRRPY